MVTGLEISIDALKAIAWEAAQSPGLEVCGLILGYGYRASHVVPARNVAADPATEFEIDPAILIGAHRRHRQGNPAVIGCYHSHPSGSWEPSPRDAQAAMSGPPLWIIVARGACRCWRLSDRRQFTGGFEPINFSYMPDGSTTIMPSPLGDNPCAMFTTRARS